MIFNKVWAMPNSKTFTIKPIKEFVEKHIAGARVVIDPFANSCKYGTITNDLNPEFDTTYHMDALAFLKQCESESADVVLYDPPYSITQAAEMYKSYGKDKLEINVANMGYWAGCVIYWIIGLALAPIFTITGIFAWLFTVGRRD